MSITKNSKMLQFVNYRMRVTLDDKRTIIGRFLAFDKHMNLVLADSEETRRTKKAQAEERRALGLVLIRGECVVSLAIESPPVAKNINNNKKVPGSVRGTAPFGRGVPLGTNITAPMPGLSAPSPALAPQSANMSTLVTPPPPGFTPAPPGM